jgi:hypothetical protein
MSGGSDSLVIPLDAFIPLAAPDDLHFTAQRSALLWSNGLQMILSGVSLGLVHHRLDSWTSRSLPHFHWLAERRRLWMATFMGLFMSSCVAIARILALPNQFDSDDEYMSPQFEQLTRVHHVCITTLLTAPLMITIHMKVIVIFFK